MSAEISWVLELNLQPGSEDKFKALMNAMVEATRADEPGTLAYEWHLSSDGTVCHIFERYADSSALLTHGANFGARFADPFLATLSPIRFVVYGSPSEEAKAALAGFNPVFMERVGGFSR